MNNRMKGYSLIEFTVSMAAALVLTATSMPMATTSVNSFNLRSDARKVAAQFQNAKFQAISGNTFCRVHVNGSSIELQSSSKGVYSVISSTPLSAGTSIASAWNADPVFSARGTVNPGASITLKNNLTGKQSIVSVSSVGVVTVQ